MVELLTLFAAYRAENDGRNINAELWEASGWGLPTQNPGYASAAKRLSAARTEIQWRVRHEYEKCRSYVMSNVVGESTINDIFQIITNRNSNILPAGTNYGSLSPSDVRKLFHELLKRRDFPESQQLVGGHYFPVERYLLSLFRAGHLQAIGNRPNDPVARKIRRIDWGGLEIAGGDGTQTLSVRRIGHIGNEGGGDFENVRVEREAVVRVFPAEVGAPKLDMVLRDSIQSKGRMLTQKEAVEIVRGRGVIATRKKILKELEILGGSKKPGPKGPRKKRAEPTA